VWVGHGKFWRDGWEMMVWEEEGLAVGVGVGRARCQGAGLGWSVVCIGLSWAVD